MILLKAQFESVLADIRAEFTSAPSVPVSTWQSVKAPQAMPELLNYSFTLTLPETMDLKEYREAFRPNLPWADDHFREDRVSGMPINPGETWKTWPFARSADTHRREGEKDPQFDHSYAERYWPRLAGLSKGGKLGPEANLTAEDYETHSHQGIRFRYGDLSDLIHVMGEDPLTRQGYLPVWFPEDLAAARDKKRVPCTLGYHFIQREGLLHCIYPMRSCDFVRHFRDDVYLTVRLQLWILGLLRHKFPDGWANVNPGTFTMHITSLHLFENDRANILQGFRQGVLK